MKLFGSFITYNGYDVLHKGVFDPATGNVATATKLVLARKINGVAFDGSSDITITAAANGGNSATVGGFTPNISASVNTIVVRDANGYIYGNYINSNRGSENTAAAQYIYDNGDGWMRKKDIANVKTELVTNAAVISAIGYTPEGSIPKTSTTPTSPANGQLWIDTTTVPYVLKQYNTSSTSWVVVGGGGGAGSGDMLKSVYDTNADGIVDKAAALWNSSGAVASVSGNNIGIGIAGPTEKLHVVGNSRVDGRVNVSNKFAMEYNSTENSLDFIFIG